MPPLEAYKFRPPTSVLVNSKDKPVARLFFYGWDNITEFELEQLEKIKVYLKEKKIEIPPGFSDRELLKFVQSENYIIDKS